MSLSAFAGRRSTLVLGGPGAGKTALALQTLVSAAREGEPGLFLALGQPAGAILGLGEGFGWDLTGLQTERLLVIHECPGAGTIEAVVRDALPLAAQLRAARVAVDDLHLAHLPGTIADQMKVMLLLRDSFFEQGLAAVFTCNLDCSPVAQQSAALLQCLVDCSVRLRSQAGAGGLGRFLRVLKYRAAPCPDWEFPFVIGAGGIELNVRAQSAPPGLLDPELRDELESTRRRFATGIQALDRFLEMKQAELDYLLEKAGEQGQPAADPPWPTQRPR